MDSDQKGGDSFRGEGLGEQGGGDVVDAGELVQDSLGNAIGSRVISGSSF